MVSVEEFMKFHFACPEGREWALAECRTMDDVWQMAKGEWLIWVATRPGVATLKENRLLAECDELIEMARKTIRDRANAEAAMKGESTS